jgi:hypothetical protein
MKPIRLMLFAVAALSALAFAGVAHAAPQSFVQLGHPTLEAIEDAYQSGEITEAQALLYRIYFLKAPHKLPDGLWVDGPPMKCGTSVLLETYERYDALADELKIDIRDEFDAYRSRPGWLTLSRETTNFVIHYTLTGADAVPNEAYVDACEVYLEDSWTAYFVDRNWDIPPPDFGGGGNTKHDMYIHNLGGGILGYAETEHQVPGDPPWDYTGYFHIQNTITNSYQRRAVIAHEFMHITQFGYCANVAWYMENCAMLGEEQAFDYVNDYLSYLMFFFNATHKTLITYNGGYEYGNIGWPMFIAETMGEEVVELTWDHLHWNGNYIMAFDEILAPYGHNWVSAFVEYKRWCLYTNDHDDGNHFEEASTWSNDLYVDWTHSSYPTGEWHPRTNLRPERMGSSVMKFLREDGSPDNFLTIDFQGTYCFAAVEFVAKLEGDVYVEHFMTLDEDGNGSIDISDFDLAMDVQMIASTGRDCFNTHDYAFWADTYYEAGAVDDDINQGDLVRIHPNRPNPFQRQTTIAYSLPKGNDVVITVHDVNGRQVRDLFSKRQAAGNYEVTWNGTDDAGTSVANGVYFAHIAIDGQSHVRELTVLR